MQAVKAFLLRRGKFMAELPKSCNTAPEFKGWTKPGPLPGQGHDLKLGDHETVDAISGHYRLFQLKKGHRFSTDDVLTAWYGTICAPSVERALDLGSGVGSVGMIAAWRLPDAHFVTVEAQEESVRLAHKSARYNGIEDRYEIRLGDMRDPEILREDEKFDLVTGSPPYWPLEDGLQSEHPQKIACRFEVRGDIADYCEVASRHLANGGVFACVFPANQLERAEKAAGEHHLTIVRRKRVFFRQGAPASLDLFAMTLDAHLPEEFRQQTWVEEPLYVRDAEGAVHPMYSAIKMSFGFPPGG